MAVTKPKRAQILTNDEIKELYDCPAFNANQREEYFALDDDILRLVNRMDKIETKVYLILLIGYFRSKAVIPKFTLRQVKDDVNYLCETYFPGKKPKYSNIGKSTRSTLVNRALSILGFQKFQKKHQTQLIARLRDVATICTYPHYMFDECLAFFGQNNISLAGYTTLQDIISEVLSEERQRTENILSAHMSDTTRQRLKNILASKGALNSLSVYKGSAKDFSPKELDQEIRTHDTIKDVYYELKSLIDKLGLSQGNLSYYASIVHHQSLYKIRRFPEWQGLLYVACYLFFRYRETNDKLVTAFQYLVRKQNESAKASAKQSVADELEVIRDKLKYAGNILRFFVDDKVSDSTTFGDIRKQAFSLISKDEISMISQHLDETDFDITHYEWLHIDKQSKKISNSIRKVFLAIDIECDLDQTALIKQLDITRSELRDEKQLSTMDQQVIAKKDKGYLIEDGAINDKRFEFYLYRRVFKLIESHRIYVSESAENKRLEDDLIPQTEWNDREVIIQKTGLSKLINPITDTLSGLTNKLEFQMRQVTHNINGGANEFVRRHPNTDKLTWTLANKRWKDDVDNPIYTQLKHMSIIEIMDYVNQKTGYLDSFNNASTRKHGSKANQEDLLACIFGNGSNYGLYHMSSVSDRSMGTLRAVNDGYIRPETTGAANKRISSAISKLSIFKYYTINETAPFGSIDGQKHACRINTFRARYSAKYFRKGKGVSAMTLVSNHVPLDTTVISPNEYEGHFAFDLLYNNTSDIQPSTLATDTHGVNNVNFAILDIFDYEFAPRYAKFKNAFHDEFDIEYGDELSIQLKNPINTRLIQKEWEKIQWIMCSLSRKTTTQSTVIKKLSNNKKNDRTLAALHEYNRLIKCQYLLEYVDNKTLRHFVQKSLNQGGGISSTPSSNSVN
ncbi:hypothetical protein A9Q81_11990 [Gammaproteobacteria bacterium 42_54_T18]|nr:hypothetical protein A9Q81_11990 [Gammaproteobacteria bacterium 42_54_T18]